MIRALNSRIGFTALGLAYGLSVGLLGVVASGGGHSNITLMLALSPFGLGILFWPILGALLSDLRTPGARYVFLCLMVLHYLGLILYLYLTWDQEIRALGMALEFWPAWMAFGIYWTGQAFLWREFFRPRVLT